MLELTCVAEVEEIVDKSSVYIYPEPNNLIYAQERSLGGKNAAFHALQIFINIFFFVETGVVLRFLHSALLTFSLLSFVSSI